MSKLTLIFCLGLMTIGSTACSEIREGMEGHQDAVARANGFTLTVDHAAQLLANGAPEVVPARTSIVDRLADLWIGYTILASELASPDTFSDLDLASVVRHDIDQDIVWQLQEGVILARAEPTVEQLRQQFEQDQPFTRVEAQHIFVRVSDSAAEAERDSLARVVDSVRQRALAGEDFDELARRYSDDAGSAAQGGRLGWISRGHLLPEVEEVIFRTPPGAIAETIRSSLGYHVVKVLNREAPAFESVVDQLRERHLDERLKNLERAYIDSLRSAANIRPAHGAVAMVKELATSPNLERLSRARRATALAHYRGGALTVGEWADFVIRGAPRTRQMFATSDSTTVAAVLAELIRNELLIKAAHEHGYGLSEAKRDSLFEGAKRDFHATAAVSRFHRDELVLGDSAIRANVDRVITELLTRQRSPQPIDRLAVALRKGQPTIQIYPDRFPAVVARLQELRASASTGENTPTRGGRDAEEGP